LGWETRRLRQPNFNHSRDGTGNEEGGRRHAMLQALPCALPASPCRQLRRDSPTPELVLSLQITENVVPSRFSGTVYAV